MDFILNPDSNLLKASDSKFLDITNNNVISKFKNLKLYSYKWREIDGKLYYFKPLGEVYYIFNELLGEDIAKLINLDTVEYKYAKYDYGKFKFYGLLSESFLDENYLYDYNLNLEKLSKYNNYKEFLFQFYNMSLLDFYTSQIDRVFSNFNIILNNNTIKLGKVFDYSASFNVLMESNIYPYFKNLKDMYSHFYKINLENNKYIYSNALLNLTFPSLNLSKILNEYPKLIINLNKLYDYDVIKKIESIELDLDIKVSDKLKEHYYNESKIKRKIIENI